MKNSVTRTSVIRISPRGIASVTFRDYWPGVAGWVRNNGMDRTDYDFVEFHRVPERHDLASILTRQIAGMEKGGTLVVGVPGPVYENRVHFCPQLPVLVGNFLHGILRELWEGKVSIFNNTNLFAIAELGQGVLLPHKNKTALLISLGSGIGSAFVIGGKVHLGDRGLAGEIGHIGLELDGKTCKCGQTGSCLELHASGPALLEAARKFGIEVTEPTELAGNPQAVGLINDARELLAGVIASIVVPLDVSLVVLGGQLVDLYNPLELSELINVEVPDFLKPITVLPAGFSAREGALIGGGIVGFGFQNVEPRELRSKKES